MNDRSDTLHLNKINIEPLAAARNECQDCQEQSSDTAYAECFEPLCSVGGCHTLNAITAVSKYDDFKREPGYHATSDMPRDRRCRDERNCHNSSSDDASSPTLNSSSTDVELNCAMGRTSVLSIEEFWSSDGDGGQCDEFHERDGVINSLRSDTRSFTSSSSLSASDHYVYDDYADFCSSDETFSMETTNYTSRRAGVFISLI